MTGDEILKRKVEFVELFKSAKQCKLSDNLFADESFLNNFKKHFAKYAKDISIWLEFRMYHAYSDKLIIFHYDSSRIWARNSNIAITLIGAYTLVRRYKDNKLAFDFLKANLAPLYNRLSMVDGVIAEVEAEEIENFIFINIAKHIMGDKSDISETIYAYFLEAEKIISGVDNGI